jgi:hypothetical protein
VTEELLADGIIDAGDGVSVGRKAGVRAELVEPFDVDVGPGAGIEFGLRAGGAKKESSERETQEDWITHSSPMESLFLS